MTARPILMSAPMVRALLAGTKTQTRRLVKWREPAQGLNLSFSGLGTERTWSAADGAPGWVLVAPTRSSWEWRSKPTRCPYGQPGDTLWVREAHAFSVVDPEGLSWHDDPENWDVIYRADPNQPAGGWRDSDGKVIPPPWRPSIHMPRWASRITLEVTGVRVERLQDISEADARAEGANQAPTPMSMMYSTDEVLRPRYREGYATLWESINGPGSWDANPWVWMIAFRRIDAS